MPAHAVVFDPPAAVVRARNRERASPVPAKVVAAQLREAEAAAADASPPRASPASIAAGPVTLVPPAFLTAPAGGASASRRIR